MVNSTWFGEYAPRRGGPASDQLARVFETELTDIAKSRFPRAFEPLVVPTASYRELMRATETLLQLQRKAVENLAPTSQGRIATLKADVADLPRITNEESYEIGHAVDICRADVVVGSDGPKFVEFNVSGGVGAMLEYEIESRVWQGVCHDAGQPGIVAPSLYNLIARLIEKTCRSLGRDPSVLLIGTLADPGKTTRYFETQVALLKGHGVSARFQDLETLPDVIASSSGFADVVGLIQLSEREANNCGWNLSALSAATNAGLFALPSQTARLVDSKKVLALLSEGLAWMSADDIAIVDRYVPWSRIVGERRVRWNGAERDLVPLLIEEQGAFVLKGAAGYSSQEVYFGLTTPEQEWIDLVQEAAESEYYIAQELVTAVRHPMQVLVDQEGTIESVLANTRISPFCVGGVATGCSMRFDPSGRVGPVTRPYGAYPGVLVGESQVDSGPVPGSQA
jgi:hypothetical protein